MRNGVSLRTELETDLPPVFGDRVQLQQVILNLVVNAIDAMSGAGGRKRELFLPLHSGAAGPRMQ